MINTSNIEKKFDNISASINSLRNEYINIIDQNSKTSSDLNMALAERDIYKKLYNEGNISICMITISTIGIKLQSIIKGDTLHIDTYGFANSLDKLKSGDVCILYNGGKGVAGYFIIDEISIIFVENRKTANIKIGNAAIGNYYINAKQLKAILNKDIYIGGKITEFSTVDGLKIVEYIGGNENA